MNKETEILLKLRRQYTENEAVQLAIQEVIKTKAELSKQLIENGKLMAEVAYLENEIQQLKKLVVDEDKIHQHPLYRSLEKAIQKMSKRAHKAEHQLAVMTGNIRKRL